MTRINARFELFAHIIYNIVNLRRVGSTLNLHDVKWNPESVGVGKAFLVGLLKAIAGYRP